MFDAEGSCTRRSFLGTSGAGLALATFAPKGSVYAQTADVEKARSNGDEMNISGMVHVNINCSDIDRSLEFYEFLGFKMLVMAPEHNTPQVAAAVRMPPYHLKGGLMILPGSTTDMDADVATLKSRGVEFLSEPATVTLENMAPSRFVCVKDPDGTILEFVQMGA